MCEARREPIRFVVPAGLLQRRRSIDLRRESRPAASISTRSRRAPDVDLHRRIDPEGEQSDELVHERLLRLHARHTIRALSRRIHRGWRNQSINPPRCPGLVDLLARGRQPGVDGRVVTAGGEQQHERNDEQFAHLLPLARGELSKPYALRGPLMRPRRLGPDRGSFVEDSSARDQDEQSTT